MTSISQDAIPTKFTGHERDLYNTASAADDLDYMKARLGTTAAGDVRDYTTDGSVAIHMESNGKLNADLNALGVAEDIHFP